MIKLVLAASLGLALAEAVAAPETAPDRHRGDGPHQRLLLRGVTVINGEGAPPVGPMDVVIEGDTIASLHNVGFPGVPVEDADRPAVRDGDTVPVGAGADGLIVGDRLAASNRPAPGDAVVH